MSMFDDGPEHTCEDCKKEFHEDESISTDKCQSCFDKWTEKLTGKKAPKRRKR